MSFSYLRATERPAVKTTCPGSGCRTLSSVLPDHSWDLDMELIYVWRKWKEERPGKPIFISGVLDQWAWVLFSDIPVPDLWGQNWARVFLIQSNSIIHRASGYIRDYLTWSIFSPTLWRLSWITNPSSPSSLFISSNGRKTWARWLMSLEEGSDTPCLHRALVFSLWGVLVCRTHVRPCLPHPGRGSPR